MQLRTHNFLLKSDSLRYQRLAQLPFLLGGLFLAAGVSGVSFAGENAGGPGNFFYMAVLMLVAGANLVNGVFYIDLSRYENHQPLMRMLLATTGILLVLISFDDPPGRLLFFGGGFSYIGLAIYFPRLEAFRIIQISPNRLSGRLSAIQRFEIAWDDIDFIQIDGDRLTIRTATGRSYSLDAREFRRGDFIHFDELIRHYATVLEDPASTFR